MKYIYYYSVCNKQTKSELVWTRIYQNKTKDNTNKIITDTTQHSVFPYVHFIFLYFCCCCYCCSSSCCFEGRGLFCCCRLFVCCFDQNNKLQNKFNAEFSEIYGRNVCTSMCLCPNVVFVDAPKTLATDLWISLEHTVSHAESPQGYGYTNAPSGTQSTVSEDCHYCLAVSSNRNLCLEKKVLVSIHVTGIQGAAWLLWKPLWRP